jgi:hypothetical protein
MLDPRNLGAAVEIGFLCVAKFKMSADFWQSLIFIYSAQGLLCRRPCPWSSMCKTQARRNNVYCKTRIFRLPFISRISRPWRRRENYGSQIFEWYNCCTSSLVLKQYVLVQQAKTPKLRAAKIKGFTVLAKRIAAEKAQAGC